MRHDGFNLGTAVIDRRYNHYRRYSKNTAKRRLLAEGLSGRGRKKRIRAADAKEVGVGNPAEETYCYPNIDMLHSRDSLSTFFTPAE